MAKSPVLEQYTVPPELSKFPILEHHLAPELSKFSPLEPPESSKSPSLDHLVVASTNSESGPSGWSTASSPIKIGNA